MCGEALYQGDHESCEDELRSEIRSYDISDDPEPAA